MSSLRRDISVFAEREYDLIIIGGGIFGICAAWDASLRGLSVALIERKDFVSRTSANSYKIIHGGIRYLQHADWVRIRSSCKERNALLRIAPHLVQPLPIVIPTYGHGKKGRELLTAGLMAYDLMTFDRNRGIKDPDRHIPASSFLCRQRVLELFPTLAQQGLTGALIFWDGQMYNPTRLALSFLRSAVAAGTKAANYVEATSFLRSGDRILGIQSLDILTGRSFQIRGRVVLNAAGPWAERLLKMQLGLALKPKETYSRDAYFVVPRHLTKKYALAVPGLTKDPDAILSREARHLFIVPWRDYTLIGVWHTVYEGEPDDFTMTARELQGFIDEINCAYPGLDLRLDDISMWNAGLVLFGENEPGTTNLSYGKRSRIIDHAKSHQLEGLVTLIGVRYTMARGDAAKAIDLVSAKLNRKVRRPATERIPIYGGQIEYFEEFVLRTTQQHCQEKLQPEIMRALLHNYGSEYKRVLRYIDEESRWAETLGTSKVIKAEVIHAVREEMSIKLVDVVFRRTDLATGDNPGDKTLQICAKLMALELGWDSERIQQEFDEVRKMFPSYTIQSKDNVNNDIKHMA